MDKKKQYKGKLSIKFMIGFLILGIFVITSSCVVGYIKYTDVIEKMYNDNAYRIADTAMESIDGDLIEDYVKQLHDADEKTMPEVSKKIQSQKEYKEILETLNVLRDRMDANYMYIADQTDGRGNVIASFIYLFDAENPNDDFPAFVPGDTGPMNEGFLDDSKAIYSTGERSDNFFYSHSAFGYNTSAIAPVKNSKGQVVAVLGVELTMDTLQKARMEYITYVAVLGALFTAFIIIAFLVYLRRKVISPIKLVTEEADAFVHNETEVSKRLSEISTGDEIEQMADSILQMEIDICSYINELTQVTAERERIGAELNIATKIQADMLPSIFPAFPERDEFDIYASMVPAKEVGGDFYDFFMADEEHLVMVMADVSGKGVPAALFMVISKTLLKNYAQNGLSSKEVLEIVNNKLCENNEADMFVTAWIGILEISTGKLICANAGHEYPVICKNGGKYELLKDKHGFVLAGMENSRQHEYELQLEKGDKLFLYTDGVPEATDEKEELYGTERMVEALNRTKASSPEETLISVKKDIDRFVGEASQFDDITMLCLKYKGTAASDPGADESKDEEGGPAAELEVDASIEEMQTVTSFVEEQMEKMEAPIKAQTQINIAVDELFSNIAYYAYGDGAGKVLVRVEALSEPRGIALTFIDKGTPYNPLEKEDPDTTLSAEERKVGGLGIFMVKKSMDEMNYQYKDGRNILRIRKNF